MTQGKKANQIFISYRRNDTANTTGRIYDRLVLKFGREVVFKDVDSVPLGVNFRRHIEAVIRECAVMLVVIGDHWLGAFDDIRNTRLDNPGDFVRVEIEAALQHNVPIIPLFVQKATMPSVESLPDSLQDLVNLNGMSVGLDPHFHADVTRLITSLEATLAAHDKKTFDLSVLLEHPAPELAVGATGSRRLLPKEKAITAELVLPKAFVDSRATKGQVRTAKWYIYIAAVIAGIVVYAIVSIVSLIVGAMIAVGLQVGEAYEMIVFVLPYFAVTPLVNAILSMGCGYRWPASHWRWGFYLSIAPGAIVFTTLALIAYNFLTHDYQVTVPGTIAYLMAGWSIVFILLLGCAGAYFGSKASFRHAANSEASLAQTPQLSSPIE